MMEDIETLWIQFLGGDKSAIHPLLDSLLDAQCTSFNTVVDIEKYVEYNHENGGFSYPDYWITAPGPEGYHGAGYGNGDLYGKYHGISRMGIGNGDGLGNLYFFGCGSPIGVGIIDNDGSFIGYCSFGTEYEYGSGYGTPINLEGIEAEIASQQSVSSQSENYDH